MWDHVDKNGDGEIDEHELSKAMRGGPPKKLANLMKKGKGPKKGKKGGKGSDSESSGSDSESSGSDDEALAQKKGKKGGKGKKAKPALALKGPSAKDIIDACDANGSGGIDIDEAHACIDAHITDPEDNA